MMVGSPQSYAGFIPQATLALSVLGLSVQNALQLPEAKGPRTLHAVELWSGVGSIAHEVSRVGLCSKPFDKNRIPGTTDGTGTTSEDVTCKLGFRNAVATVLQIVEEGLLWCAPDCSSHCYLNAAKTKRSGMNPAGDTTYAPVFNGNLQGAVAAFLFVLACARNVFVVVENPVGSYLFQLQPWLVVQTHFTLVTDALACRCRFSREPLGQRVLKRYRLVGLAWVASLDAPCHCGGKGHQRTTIDVVVRGMPKITGKKEILKKSGAYPVAFAKWVVTKWLAQAPAIQALVRSLPAKRPYQESKNTSAQPSWKNPCLC